MEILSHLRIIIDLDLFVRLEKERIMMQLALLLRHFYTEKNINNINSTTKILTHRS